MKAQVRLDDQSGVVQVTLTGNSHPQQLVLSLLSPPSRKGPPRRPPATIRRPYSGHLEDSVSGRRFVELIGQEDGQDWRLFEEETLENGSVTLLGE